MIRLWGLLLAVLLLAGCESSSTPTGSPSDGATQTVTPSPTQTPPPAATPAPRPTNRACHNYEYADAVAPVVSLPSVACQRKHTAITYLVGELDTMVDGHLLSVDSDLAQAQVAAACPEAFVTFVGGTDEQRRLSMLRPVWFTPTVDEGDAGADWFRCDAIALAADGRLAPLTGRLQGALDRPEQRSTYSMCGTAEPGTKGFARVICSAKHSWRATRTIPIDGARYPGLEQVRAAGQEPCQDTARDAAEDPLNYRWGYEWPTETQWRAGQHYGICWAPA